MVHPLTEDPILLLAQAREGDLAAFSRLMEGEQTQLLAQALAFGADLHQAQDLVQETMIAAWKNLHRFDGFCRFFTWLYVILLRQHRRSLGWSSRRLPLATLEQQLVATRQAVQLHESSAPVDNPGSGLLRAMMLALPTRHREVVRLRFYAQASESEIASALNISTGTVKSRLHHALDKMRRMKEKMNLLRNQEH